MLLVFCVFLKVKSRRETVLSFPILIINSPQHKNCWKPVWGLFLSSISHIKNTILILQEYSLTYWWDGKLLETTMHQPREMRQQPMCHSNHKPAGRCSATWAHRLASPYLPTHPFLHLSLRFSVTQCSPLWWEKRKYYILLHSAKGKKDCQACITAWLWQNMTCDKLLRSLVWQGVQICNKFSKMKWLITTKAA